MNNDLCKKAVHGYFNKIKPLVHIDNKSLKIGNINYRIQPDDSYILNDSEIILIEYENNKRPVESISKYWWLFEKTDWLDRRIIIKLLLIITNPSLNEIRYDSIVLLGQELSKRYPDKFYFVCLDYQDLQPENINQKLSTLIKLKLSNHVAKK